MPDIYTSKTEGRAKPLEAVSEVTVSSGGKNVSESGLRKAELPPELAGRSKGGVFSAFSINPRGVVFQTQESDEQVILLMRRHVVTNVPWIAAVIWAFLLPILLSPFILELGLLTGISLGNQFVFTLLWYTGIFTFAFLSFINWYFNVYIVTNERIIDVDFVNLTYKQISHAPIFKIQDLRFEQVGVVAGIFNYGTVLIQTAGELPNFDFDDVPNPAEVVKIISDLIQTENDEGGGT